LFSLLGDRLAFVREVEGGDDLWVIDADGAGLLRLGGPYRALDWLEFSPIADAELNPVFTPDGTQLLHQQRNGLDATEPGQWHRDSRPLWLAPADGSGPARDLGIESRVGDGFAVTVAPDARSLLVHLWGENEDWLVDPATASATKTDLGSSSGVSWQRTAP